MSQTELDQIKKAIQTIDTNIVEINKQLENLTTTTDHIKTMLTTVIDEAIQRHTHADNQP